MVLDTSLAQPITPMMKQYFEIKDTHKDCLLLFRMGDFYELFYQDAIIAAPILGVVLTKRGKTQANQDIEMCGIPHHSSSGYIKKLIEKGYKVAICDQLETPEEAKKRGHQAVVKREVVRIVTPGTITEDNLLDNKSSNYLASISIVKDQLALAYVDISTLEFSVASIDIADLSSYLSMVSPSEIIISDDLFFKPSFKEQIEQYKEKIVTFADSFFDIKKTTKKLLNNFRLHSQNSLADFNEAQISCCGSLVEYLSITQKKESVMLSFPKILNNSDYMIIDRSAQNNLEIISSKNEQNLSLFKIIDRTITSQGGRLLKKYIAFPSAKINIIEGRLELVRFFTEKEEFRAQISELLKSTSDLERSLSKLAIGRGSPNDLYNIFYSLRSAEHISTLLKKTDTHKLQKLCPPLESDGQIRSLFEQVLIPRDLYLNQNDFINHSYNHELSELYKFRNNIRDSLENLRNEYKDKTGISNIKIEYNNVLGYYIEVTKSQIDKIRTDEFIHKQTMMNCSRYVTEKLKNLEDKILSINEQIALSESKIFQEVSHRIIEQRDLLLQIAQTISFLDVICSFANIAKEKNYCMPTMTQGTDFEIENGRHPIVELALSKNKHEQFVPNDCNLTEEKKIWLITGPNMAGKSTFLRQNALIAVLAHMGSYVPATKAKIGLVDRIFTRIGAGDDLAQGHSTFLVEMIETATILNQATKSSLIILDEIGRGTSTYDGMAIAFSCLEYIHNKIKCRTLFSTHYHEIVKLSEKLKAIDCYTVKVKEWENKVIFMHKLTKGIANKSYGINVAELAGIPESVISRSKEILFSFTEDQSTSTKLNDNLSLFDISQRQENPVIKKIKNINIDELTPKQALDILYKLKGEC